MRAKWSFWMTIERSVLVLNDWHRVQYSSRTIDIECLVLPSNVRLFDRISILKKGHSLTHPNMIKGYSNNPILKIANLWTNTETPRKSKKSVRILPLKLSLSLHVPTILPSLNLLSNISYSFQFLSFSLYSLYRGCWVVLGIGGIT